MGINEYEEMVEANKSTAVEEGEEDLGEVKTIEVEEEMRGEGPEKQVIGLTDDEEVVES